MSNRGPIWKGWKYSWDDFANDSPFRSLHDRDLNKDDYASLQDWQDDLLFGNYARKNMKRLEDEENARKWERLSKRFNIDLENIDDPISAGLYGNYGGSATFDVSDAVLDMYYGLNRWF